MAFIVDEIYRESCILSDCSLHDCLEVSTMRVAKLKLFVPYISRLFAYSVSVVFCVVKIFWNDDP